MLSSIKNREDLERINEIVLSLNQMKALRLQGNLEKQKFQEDMKKAFEPVTETIKYVSEDVTKSITETSVENNEALSNLNVKLLKILKDKFKLASYLLSLLNKITIPENTSQFKLVKDPQ